MSPESEGKLHSGQLSCNIAIISPDHLETPIYDFSDTNRTDGRETLSARRTSVAGVPKVHCCTGSDDTKLSGLVEHISFCVDNSLAEPFFFI